MKKFSEIGKVLWLMLLFTLIANISHAQLGEIEGDVRISSTRPKLELYDITGGQERVEADFSAFGNDLFIKARYGNLVLSAEDDNMNPINNLEIDGGTGDLMVRLNKPASNFIIQKSLFPGSEYSYENNGKTQKWFMDNGLRGSLGFTSTHRFSFVNYNTPSFRYSESYNITTFDTMGIGSNRFGINGKGDVGIGHVVQGSNIKSCIHLRHRLSSDDPREDGVRITNGGVFRRYFTLYVVNSNNDLQLYSGQTTAAIGSFNATTGVYSALSDARYKTTIEPLTSCIDKMQKLNPVSYFFKHDASQEKKSFGLLAQELKKEFPELVSYTEETDIYHVDYSGLTVLLLKGFQEQQERIKNQEDEFSQLQEENKVIKEQMRKLMDALNISDEYMD